MALMFPASRVATRPARLRSAAVRPSVRMVVVRSKASLDTQVQEALKAAEEECDQKGVASKDCEVAWDQAEELLAAKSHKRDADKEFDPLEDFCKGNEDADECRIHEL